MPRMAPMTTSTLRIIPTTPSVQFKYQFVLHLCGFLICIHMKQGYAKVIGRAAPPIRPAKLRKNGKATAIKNAQCRLKYISRGYFTIDVGYSVFNSIRERSLHDVG